MGFTADDDLSRARPRGGLPPAPDGPARVGAALAGRQRILDCYSAFKDAVRVDMASRPDRRPPNLKAVHPWQPSRAVRDISTIAIGDSSKVFAAMTARFDRPAAALGRPGGACDIDSQPGMVVMHDAARLDRTKAVRLDHDWLAELTQIACEPVGGAAWSGASGTVSARRGRTMIGNCRWLVAIVASLGLVLGTATAADAEPLGESAATRFPDIAHITAWYTELQPDEFFIAGRPGAWFLSPSGLNCGIWPWGSFGCKGDIPGAPAGDNHIAWFNGNRAVHHGWTAAVQFPAGQAERPLPPRSYVTYESTTCATTPDANTYCSHGEFKFLITPQGTWFKAWDDRRSYVCNAYGSCPPG